MLVLSRKPGEAILIGDEIKVTYLMGGGRGGAAKFGIEAPRNVAVRRAELRAELDADDGAWGVRVHRDTDGEDGTTEGEQS